jgi:hypothetical protein
LASPHVVLDDRLLIEELLVGLPKTRRRVELHTTSYWYFRACRAAAIGAGGHLSGPFEQVPAGEQARAVLSLLELRDDIGLPDPRMTVPLMAQLAARHTRLNVLNLEATAMGRLSGGTVWLSEASAAGILPGVLDHEGVAWVTIDLDLA